MKNDSLLTRSMDVPREDGSHNNAINSLKEFDDSSDYNEALEEDEKPNDNVNTTALGWPLRHNNDADNLAYTFNGFRQIKKPCFTYAGRISRLPSRYLDTDSSGGDGSTRDDVVSRLKVKRRRKRSSTTNKKSLVNGFKEHDEKVSLKLNNIHAETIICNLNEQARESLTNLNCSEVLGDVSPVSDDTISYITHEARTRQFFPIHNTPSEALKEQGRFFEVNLNGILDSNQDSVSEFGLKDDASVCCLEATRGCVDISTENKGLTRFDSRMVSPDPSLTHNSRDNETSNECKRERCLNDLSTTEVSYATCKRTLESSSCDTSTNDIFVSSTQNSKQRKVSCASLVSNNSDASSQKGKGDTCCFESGEISSVHSCLASGVEPVIEPEPDTRELVKEDVVLPEACCFENSDISPNKLQKETAKEQRNEDDCAFKPKGLNCFKNFKMKRNYNYYTNKKLNQKQLRRTERVNGNSGLKKHGVIDQLKRKSVSKVDKAVRLKKKINLNANEKDVQNVNQVKTSFSTQELDRVLGMRRTPVGVYEFLVQWTNGTSCWVSSDQIVANKHNYILREYLVENDQDISVINRIPFQAYCCDSLSLKECKPEVKPSKVKKMLLGKACPSISRIPIKKNEVSVENDGDHCYITVNRETCKRKLTCVKIITELITALEDASVSECELVIIKGLGSKVFGGLNLEIITKASAEEKGNKRLSKMRYLVQTLCNYPKPLVALISKAAEGIGAVILSLFDLIWDEDAWKKMQNDERSQELSEDTSLYSLPRVAGHSGPSEEILMGKECERLQPYHPSSFAKETCDENSHHSMVVSTLKEVETTLQNLGKRTSLLDINGEDIFKMAMNQSSDGVHVPGVIATCNSAIESEIDSLTVDTDISYCPSTSSTPADRYVKELESQILQEKQKYFKEIMSIFNDPSSVLSSEKC